MSFFFTWVLAPITAAALALLGAGTGRATELITNGDFETGDFSGWTQGGDIYQTEVSSLPLFYGSYTPVLFSGDTLGKFSAFPGPEAAVGILSQTLNTVVGDTYRVGFDMANLGPGPNSFLAVFGTNTILQKLNFAATTVVISHANYLIFSRYGGSFVATSNFTPLTFTFLQIPSEFVIDNVSVAGTPGAVPESATWMLMLVGFGGIGLSLRGSRGRDSDAACGQQSA